MRAKEFLTELWTQPYPITARATGPANMEYGFKTKDDRSGRIVFDSFLDTDQGGTHVVLVIVHFYIDGKFETTGSGDAIAIFSTVVSACRDYLRRYRPPVVAFETDDDKKRNLYVKMSKMFPDYLIYPNWVEDPVVGDEIKDTLMYGIDEDATVLRRKDYDPNKTRVYIDEYAPEGFAQFNLYISDGIKHHLVGTFSSIDDAKEELEYIWNADPETKLVIWFIKDLNDNTVWYYDPQELADQPRYTFRKPDQGVAENFAGRKFVEPNFDVEWEEAERYPEFVKLGKDAWIKLARKGKAVTITSARGIDNTDAADPNSFKSLVPEKQKRALAQLKKGTVEMPIVAVYSDGRKELIGGNTRLTAMMAKDGKATVWAFRVPGQQGVAENVDIGREWMSDTELDQYVPEPLQQDWRELVGYDEDGNLSKYWAFKNEPNMSTPIGRVQILSAANLFFRMKKIPLTAFEVRDIGDELEWLIQVGPRQDVTETNLTELKRDDSYRGNDDDRIISWEEAKATFKQFAEDSLADDFEERDNGQTIMTTWGPETKYPYSCFTMFLSPLGNGILSGMLFGLYADGEFDVIKEFHVPCSYNGIDYAARIYMGVRS